MKKKEKLLWFQKHRKKVEEKASLSAEEKPVNLAEERLKKKKRSKKRMALLLALLLVVILILQVWSAGISKGSSAAVEEEVVSSKVEIGDMDQVLKSSGVLSNASEEAISIPGDISVTSYLVKNGDTVKKGDPIAVIKKSSVMAALADLQELMDQLDQEMSDVKEDSIASTIKATAEGTVVKVYATSGTDVVDTMYEKGALLLLSLDGLLAVEIDNPGNVKVGSTLTVKDTDGNTYDGQVASVEKDTVVVTVSLKKFSYGEKVTVLDSEKEKLGSGKLYIYSQQKITGYSGTVSSVKVSKGDVVSKGDILITLSNTDYTAAYQTLLNKRTVLENQYNELVEIGNSGYVYAAADGTVSGIEESLLTDQAAAQENGFAATSSERVVDASTNVGKTSLDIEEVYGENTTCSSNGFQNMVVKTGETGSSNDKQSTQGTGFIKMSEEAESSNDKQSTQGTGFIKTSEETGTTADTGVIGRTANPEETISKSVNLVWMNGDGTVLTEGMPKSVKVELVANGVKKEEQVLDASKNWSYTWSGLSKYDSEGKEITYTIKNTEEIQGYTAVSQVSGTVTLLICTKKTAGNNGQNPSEGTTSDNNQNPTGENTSGNNQNPTGENTSGNSQNPTEGTISGNQNMPDNNTDQNNKPGGADTKKEDGQKLPSGNMPNQTGNQGTGKEAGGQSTLGDTQASSSDTQTEETSSKYEYGETTICSFIPNDTVEVEITVDELDIHSVKEGQKCTLTLDAFPSQSFTGTVNSVNQSGTNSGGNTKYTATVTMEKEENMLTGMNASVQIVLSTQNNVLVIPEAALVEQDGKVYVCTEYNKKKDELEKMVEVTTGLSDGENVQILAGLEEGQQIYYRYAGTISYTFLK